MTKNVTKINMRAGNKIESNLKILLMSDTKITHLYQKTRENHLSSAESTPHTKCFNVWDVFHTDLSECVSRQRSVELLMCVIVMLM